MLLRKVYASDKTRTVLFTILTLASLFFFLQSTSWAKESKTLFLPLQLSQTAQHKDLKQSVDKAVQLELEKTNFSYLNRDKAEKIINYSGSWPPPVKELQTLAQSTGSDNIIVGSLTTFGKQLSIDVKLFDLLSPQKPTFYFQTAKSIDELQPSLNRILAEIRGYLEKEIRIASISLEGNSRIDSGAILRKIKTKSGDAYDQSILRNDLKEIFNLGYFNDVQIDVTDSAKGKNVTFQIIEKPVIKSVLYEGIDELEEDDVKDAANIKEHFILNPIKIAAAENAIIDLYKTKGFYNSKVKTEVTYPDDIGAVVKFVIDEGEEVYIKEITVEGNEAYDDDELLDEIETSERWFMSWMTDSGLLDRNQIQEDAQEIVTFYHNEGYLDAKISDPVITQKEEWLYIKFIVEEGPRFRVGTVDFEGDILEDKQTLLDMLLIRDEEFLSKKVIRDDILKITDHYAEFGYAFAKIRTITRKSPEGDRMDIKFKISKGNLVYINRITIKGNTRTRDNVIRRELKIAEGGVFDSKAIRNSTQALQRLMYFSDVTITPEPSLDPDRMDIVIEVKEKSTGTFSIGAGYSSVDKLILMGQISENNFLGRGDTLSFSANLSDASSRYNLSYTNPHVNDSELSWGFDLFSTEREYDDYTKESKGGAVRIGYPIFKKWRIFGKYSYTDTDLTEVSDDASYIIRNSVDLHVTSAIKVSLVRDTRNRRFGASSGSRTAASIKYGGGPLGGDAEFTKVEGSTSWFFPMPFGTVFHVKGAIGQVFENENDKLPVYERYYLGGLNSIRGFDYAKISPIDPATDERIGGDKMWYTNVEVIFPLLKDQGVNGVVFFDSGQVLNDDEDWGEVNDTIKKATGFGIRWLSPMGPLRLVWGYNLDPKDGEDDAVWDFSVGGTF